MQMHVLSIELHSKILIFTILEVVVRSRHNFMTALTSYPNYHL